MKAPERLRAQCAGKRAYKSAGDARNALLHAKRLHEQGIRAWGETPRAAYRCGYCAQYHLTRNESGVKAARMPCQEGWVHGLEVDPLTVSHNNHGKQLLGVVSCPRCHRRMYTSITKHGFTYIGDLPPHLRAGRRRGN